MDLPKNITQIGEADASCKIYVEDYVVSFLKQLNPLAKDKTMAAALYGKRTKEEASEYLFIYGAGKLDFLQKETRHLSQAQRQEIERIRRQYFGDYEFLGYRILDGEMVDGFHVCDQDGCRYVTGYAQFYEKNEAMLSYMLESRQVDAAPESVNTEKYDAVRSRQEKRREKYHHPGAEDEQEEGSGQAKNGLRVAAATLLVLLGAMGFAMNSPALKEKGLSWERLKEELRGKQSTELTETSGQELLVQAGSKGTDANEGQASGEKVGLVLSEKAGQAEEKVLPTAGKAEVEKSPKPAKDEPETEPAEAVADKNESGTGQESEAGENLAKEETTAKAGEEQNQGTSEDTKEKDQAAGGKGQVTYVVKKGDTLTGISIRTYGSDKYVARICELNSIVNPDEIKVGQKILLP